MKPGCCKNVKVCFKKGSEDQLVDQLILPEKQIAFQAPIFIIAVQSAISVPSEKKSVPLREPPPPDAFPSKTIRNCVFLI